MKNFMTENGYDIVSNKIKKLKSERDETLNEMHTVRDAALSTDDTSEIGQFTQRYQSLNDQISELQKVLTTSEIIDISERSNEKAQFGSIVKLYDVNNEKEMTYQILGTYETDPKNGIISHTSPLGKSLLGLEVDDLCEVELGHDFIEYEIVEIR